MLVAMHHEEQKLLVRNVVAELAQLWPLLDFHNLKGTTAPWLKAVRPIIEKGYLTSQYVAAQFVNSYRSAVLPVAEPLNVNVPNPFGALGVVAPADRDTQLRIMVAMKVTGPGWMIKNSRPGMTEDQVPQIMRDGFSKSTGAATRIVLNGGRGMVRTFLDADPEAIGIQAVADDDACRACTTLAETPLMKDKHSSRQLDAVAVGHDFCTCSAKLIYQ